MPPGPGGVACGVMSAILMLAIPSESAVYYGVIASGRFGEENGAGLKTKAGTHLDDHARRT